MGLKWYDFAHFIIGLVSGILNMYSPVVALQAVLMFLFYELLEQLRIGDKGYRDVLAFGIGWFIGVILLLG